LDETRIIQRLEAAGIREKRAVEAVQGGEEESDAHAEARDDESVEQVESDL